VGQIKNWPIVWTGGNDPFGGPPPAGSLADVTDLRWIQDRTSNMNR
jgi:hypothetical protein